MLIKSIITFLKSPAILFWILLYFVFFLQLFSQTSFIEALLFPLFLLVSIYPITGYLSKNLLYSAITKKSSAIFLIQFFVLSAVIGFIFFGYVWLFYYLESKSYFPHSAYFDLEATSLNYYSVLFAAGIIINICICSLEFYLESVKLNNSLLAAQLQTLQQQITPHVMFNILNHIHILMQSNIDMASALLMKYSDILRYQLYTGSRQIVSLDKDIQFLKDFVDIEQIRWGSKLTVEACWKIEKANLQIPVLLFIPFIENAFKHVSKSSEQNYIIIKFEQRGHLLDLQVHNSKSILTSKKTDSSGLGLKNIKERLKILFHENHTLVINDLEHTYETRLTIKLNEKFNFEHYRDKNNELFDS